MNSRSCVRCPDGMYSAVGADTCVRCDTALGAPPCPTGAGQQVDSMVTLPVGKCLPGHKCTTNGRRLSGSASGVFTMVRTEGVAHVVLVEYRPELFVCTGIGGHRGMPSCWLLLVP